MNVLFMSVGRRVELLRAFRRAYRALGLKGKIVALDIDPLAPALQVAERPYIVPSLEDPRCIPTIVKILERERVSLVFPLADWDIPFLAAARPELERTGARVAVVSAEAVRLTRDKWLTMDFFHRLGLPTPKSWLPSEIDPNQLEFPLFIKPRMGSAAKGTFRLSSRRELDFFTSYVDGPMIQEFLPGPEITSDVICDLEGRLLGVVSRRRIEVRWGEVAKGVTVCDAQIADASARIARELPAVGPITVQCILKDGRPYFTEINARLAGGVPLTIQAGVDVPRWLLASAAGMRIAFPTLGAYSTGLYMTRYDESYFLTQDDYVEMAGRRF